MASQHTAGEPHFSADTIIADAIAHGSDVAAVFIRYRMHCIGCTFARFESLRAAAVNHQVDVEEFVNSLNEVVRKTTESSEEGSQAGDPANHQFTEEV